MSTIVLENSGSSFNSTGINGFVFSNHTDLTKQPSDEFFTFHRMNGSLSLGSSIAIDFDLTHHTFRTINTTAMLSIPLTISTPLTTGTWSHITDFYPHITFPSLDLLIPSGHYYAQSCYFEPYMTVLRASSLLSQPWNTTFNPSQTLMRTAGLGKEISEIMVCAKLEEYIMLNEEKTAFVEEVMSEEEFLVMLGWFAVSRRENVPKNVWGHFYPCEHEGVRYEEDGGGSQNWTHHGGSDGLYFKSVLSLQVGVEKSLG
jgi:hypothetical protein